MRNGPASWRRDQCPDGELRQAVENEARRETAGPRSLASHGRHGFLAQPESEELADVTSRSRSTVNGKARQLVTSIRVGHRLSWCNGSHRAR